MKVHKQRIRLVGLELEGVWTTSPPSDVIHDGSVQFNHMPNNAKHIGEVCTGKEALHPKDFSNWLRANYPQHVNETCGLHVHMSFHNKFHYQLMMQPNYMLAIVDSLKNFAEAVLKLDFKVDYNRLIDRLNNPKHRYCAQEFRADAQAAQRKKDYQSRGQAHSRYTAINYCYGQHGTLECRILPMFTLPALAEQAVQIVIDTTEQFLAKQRQRPVPVNSELHIDTNVPRRIQTVSYL